MNVEEVNKVIDNLAAKFGTTASMLIPEISKYYITRHSVSIIILSLIILSIVWIFTKTIKNYIAWQDKDEESIWTDMDIVGAILFVSGIVGAILMGILIVDIVNLTGWLASPTAATIEYVLTRIK